MEELVVRRAGLSPVKGMRHLDLDHVDLDDRGPVGDRVFCLVDPARRRVLRTVQHPSLIGVVARTYDDALALSLPSGEQADGPAPPSGETVTCDYWGREVDLALTDGPHADVMSAHLGQDVRLARAPRGAVVFGGPISVVTTASLHALGEGVQPARFRATLVVETDLPWVEDDWLGRTMTVGGATIGIGGPIPRCAVIDHHPETGERDTRLLKAMAGTRPTNKAGEPMFGVYARVIVTGQGRRHALTCCHSATFADAAREYDSSAALTMDRSPARAVTISAHPSRHEAYGRHLRVRCTPRPTRPATASACGRSRRRCRRGHAGRPRARPGPARSSAEVDVERRRANPTARPFADSALERVSTDTRSTRARSSAWVATASSVDHARRRRAPLLPLRAEGVGGAATPGGEDSPRSTGRPGDVVRRGPRAARGGRRSWRVGGRVEGDRSREDHGRS